MTRLERRESRIAFERGFRRVVLAIACFLSAQMGLVGVAVASADAPILQIDSGGHLGNINGLAFSKDGRTLYSAGQDKVIRVWDWRERKVIRSLRGQIGDGVEGAIHAIALSPDERRVAVGGWMHAVCQGHCGDIRLFDMATGEVAQVLSGAHKGTLTDLIYSTDGTLLASAGYDGRAVIWDVSTGSARHVLEGHGSQVQRVAFTPDGRRLITTTASGAWHVWDVATGDRLRTTQGHNGAINGLAVGVKSQYFATAGDDQALKTWNVETGEETFSGAPQLGALSALDVTPDGKRLVISVGIGFGNSLVAAIDSDDPPVLLEGLQNVRSAAVSPDGKIGAFSINDRIELRDLATGKSVGVLAGRGSPKTGVGFDQAGRLAWGSGLNQLAVQRVFALAQTGGPLETLSQAETGLILKILIGSATPDDIAAINTPALKAKAERILDPELISAIGSLDTALRLPDPERKGLAGQMGVPRPLADGQAAAFSRTQLQRGDFAVRYAWGGDPPSPIGRLEVVKGGTVHTSRVRKLEPGCLLDIQSLAGAPDDPILLSGGCVTAAYGVDGALKGQFVGHQQAVGAMAISPDQRLLATASGDQTVRIWNVATREPIAAIFHANDGEWIIWLPSGHYAASPGGDRMIGWHINQGHDKAARYILAGQLRQHFYRPDIVSRAIELSSAKAALDEAREADPEALAFSLDDIRLRDVPKFRVVAAETTDDAFAEVTIELEAGSDPVEGLDVHVNSVRATPNELRGLSGNQQDGLRRTIRVPLEPGQNRIDVTAANAIGRTTRGTIVLRRGRNRPARRGTLYVVAIGVNSYDPSVGLANLSFAEADAEAFLQKVTTTLGRQHSATKTLLVTQSGDRAPTSSNVRRALRFFRKATADDTTVLFLAGHGVQDGPDYLFLPSNAEWVDGDWDPDTVLLWSTLEAAISRANGRRLLFVDTCRSGGAYNARLVKDTADAGVVAFSATNSEALAEERDDLGHGVFTYALIEGLKGQADVFPVGAPDGAINMYELAAFVTDKVSRLTRQAQRPELNARRFTDFVIAQLNG